MLLGEGHMLYNGPASDVVTWMDGFGLQIPFGTSIADFVLDCSMGEAGVTSSGHTGDAAVSELWTAWQAHTRSSGGTAAAHTTAAALPLPLPPAGGGAPVLKSETPGVGGGRGGVSKSSHHQRGASAQREGASYWEQVSVLTGRALKVRRFEQLNAGHFVQLLFVAAIAGLVWWQRGSTYTLLNGTDVLGGCWSWGGVKGRVGEERERGRSACKQACSCTVYCLSLSN